MNNFNRTQNNNLISGYHNYQKNNVPFQNNQLLMNTPQFQNIVNNQTQNSDMYAYMLKLKQAQELKKMQKFNDIDKVFDKAIIHESVIKPIKINKNDISEFNALLKKRESTWKQECEDCWKNKTNQPYKKILKNENYNKAIKNENDLIVHKVTDADKIGLMDELYDFANTLEKHNGQLVMIYSLDKESEHKKNFIYKYQERVKYDPKDYDGLKKDQIEYYKKQQMELEKNKKKVDDIIEYIMERGLLSESDIKEFDNENKMADKIDVKIEEQTKQIPIKANTDHKQISNTIDDLKAKYKNRQKK